MPKITNKQPGPASIYVGGISMAVPPGEFIESDDFLESELKFYGQYPESFEVSGTAVEGSGVDAHEFAELAAFKSGVGPIAERLKIGDSAIFTQTVLDELDAGDKAKAMLAEIVALFGTDEVDELNVKAAVERLIQDQKSQAPAPTPGAENQPTDLAAAIALLDDANDDQWTQAGLPDISTLKTLTGGDVTRAMVDQLPDGDKRVRKV